MNSLTLSMAFLMGLTGSLHCAGMCGPIIWIMPFNNMVGLRKWLSVFLYHFGRVTVYALMALVLHSFKSLFHPQWQQTISIVLGSVFLLAGIVSFIPGSKLKIALPWMEIVKRQLGKYIGNPALPAIFTSGMLNGLLPCGMVYMALSATVSAGNAVSAMGLMYAFGFGTMPMLISITILKRRFSVLNIHFAKLVPVTLFVFGSLFVMRGMNLGIPYLSPKVVVEHNEVKASCCHKAD